MVGFSSALGQELFASTVRRVQAAMDARRRAASGEPAEAKDDADTSARVRGTLLAKGGVPSMFPDLPRLVKGLQHQEHGSWCGIASSSIALRYLLGAGAPESTQRELYDKHVLGIVVGRKHGMRYGLTLTNVRELLEGWSEVHSASILARGDAKMVDSDTAAAAAPAAAAAGSGADGGTPRNVIAVKQVSHALPTDTEEALTRDLEALFPVSSDTVDIKPRGIMIANLWRRAFGHRGGHMVPVAGYVPTDVSTSSPAQLLLLDVAGHRTTPHWVRVAEFATLLARPDRTVNKPRGYLVVHAHTDAPYLH